MTNESLARGHESIQLSTLDEEFLVAPTYEQAVITQTLVGDRLVERRFASAMRETFDKILGRG